VKSAKTFFIADDDPDDRELFTEALKQIDSSCQCITALDGEEALDKLLYEMEFLPDFIFLDLNMPRSNGKECLATIKKDDRFADIPVIIYSTSSDKKEQEESIQLGAAYFLQKPNRFDDLTRALANILDRNWQ
jgi:CheY-like chemotaxis protein